MFIVPPEVQYRQDLSPRAKFTLQALASHCGQTDQAWPSMKRLARFMSQSVRTAQRGMRELIEKGLVKRTLRHVTTPLYTVTCMVQRGPSRAERRRQTREEEKKPAPNLSTDRGDNPVTRPLGSPIPFLEQPNNNDHYSDVQVHPAVQASYPQERQPQNNGYEDKPLRKHPSEVRLLAEDIADLLGYQSWKYWLRICWRATEQAVYEALSFVKNEMLEGHAENPCGLFVYRLRTFHRLRI